MKTDTLTITKNLKETIDESTHLNANDYITNESLCRLVDDYFERYRDCDLNALMVVTEYIVVCIINYMKEKKAPVTFSDFVNHFNVRDLNLN